MKIIGTYRCSDRVGKYFADRVCFCRFLALFIGSGRNFGTPIPYFLLFCLKRRKRDSIARKFPSLIAPDIWVLGKNDFESLASCHRVRLLAGGDNQGAYRER